MNAVAEAIEVAASPNCSPSPTAWLPWATKRDLYLPGRRLSSRRARIRTPLIHFTPQHWVLCHMGLHKFNLEILLINRSHGTST